MPNSPYPTRREGLKTFAGAAAAAWLQSSFAALAFPVPAEGETPIPFLDEQPVSSERAMLDWSKLDSWITPSEQFFSVAHYDKPEIDPASYRLEIGGLVKQAKSFTLDEIKQRPKRETIATLECAGNGVSVKFMGAIGNLRWLGTSVRGLLRACGPLPSATEVVFYGPDQGTEKIRGDDYPQNFARSLPVDEIEKNDVLLIYSMNGEPLNKDHGGPVRLCVPGHYGVSWVKWLSKIELIDRRFMGKFMGRDYVTIRGEEKDGKTIWRETAVNRMRLKSMVGRVLRRPDGSIRITGAVWNDGVSPIKSVEVKIDEGAWQVATLGEGQSNRHAWTFWEYVWANPPAGEHTIVSRGIDLSGHAQPSAGDPEIRLKKTYWEATQQYPRKILL